MLRIRLFLVLLFCMYGSSVWATDYYWLNGYELIHYSDAMAGCDGFLSFQQGKFTDGSTITKSSSSKFYDDSHYSCVGDLHRSNGTTALGFTATTVSRLGTSCPTDYTYNSATGSCDAPSQNLCQQAIGASTNYYVKTQLDAEPPDQVDINGCLAQFGGVITCRNTTDGYGVCTGTATITGEQTTTSSPVAGDPATVDDTPQVKSEELPCSPTTDPATGASVCTTQSTFSQPGESTCGTMNGKLVCTEVVKSKSEDKVVQTKTETSNDPNGSAIKTTTTTTSKTSCVGINNCTTTTSTAKKSTLINPDGSVNAEISSCTGTGCTDPTKSDEEKAGEGLPSGELKEPKKGNYDDALAEWDQKIADAKKDFKDRLAQIKDLVSSKVIVSLPSGGSGGLFCKSVPVFGTTFDLCLDHYADQLAYLKVALIFIATLIAFYIIFRE